MKAWDLLPEKLLCKNVSLIMKSMNCFCFYLHVRQHTLAFIPSSGKIDSFGLGGNGQLGTRTTYNRMSPAPVKGCWRAHTDPVPMDIGELTVYMKSFNRIHPSDRCPSQCFPNACIRTDLFIMLKGFHHTCYAIYLKVNKPNNSSCNR